MNGPFWNNIDYIGRNWLFIYWHTCSRELIFRTFPGCHHLKCNILRWLYQILYGVSRVFHFCGHGLHRNVAENKGHKLLVPPRCLPGTMLSLVAFYHCKYFYAGWAPNRNFSCLCVTKQHLLTLVLAVLLRPKYATSQNFLPNAHIRGPLLMRPVANKFLYCIGPALHTMHVWFYDKGTKKTSLLRQDTSTTLTIKLKSTCIFIRVQHRSSL